MTRSQEKHWFHAYAEGPDGARHFSASKQGRSIYIQEAGGKRHLCHPMVRDIESAKREIVLVFHVSVTRIES